MSLVGSVGNLPSSRRMCNMLPWLRARSQNMDAGTPLEATGVNISGSEASHREEGRNSIFGKKPPSRGWWQPFPSSFYLKLTDIPLLRNFPNSRFLPFQGFFLKLLVRFWQLEMLALENLFIFRLILSCACTIFERESSRDEMRRGGQGHLGKYWCRILAPLIMTPLSLRWHHHYIRVTK